MSLALPTLPNGWAWSTVEELGDHNAQVVTTGPFGTSIGRDDFIEAGVPVLTIGCLTEAGLDMSKAVFVSPDKAKELSRYQLTKGDLLFSRMASVGRMGIVGAEHSGSLFNYHIMRLRLRSGLYEHSLFVNYVRGSSVVQDYLREVNHGATRAGINTEQLLQMPVPVPPIPTQRRIVEALDSYLTRLDAATEGLKRVEANLKRYRASVLKAAVEGRLVPTETELTEEHGGVQDLPQGWRWISVNELLSQPLCHGKSVQTRIGGTLVLRLTCLGGEYVDQNEAKDGDWSLEEARPFLIESGDFLVSRGNGSIRLVGRGAVVGEVDRPVAFPDTLIRIRPDTTVIRTRYLAATWNSYFIRQQIERKAKTTAGIHKINQADLRSIILPLPPLAVQDRIVDVIDHVLTRQDHVSEAITNTLCRVQSLRQSILKWAFEGKLVDQDPADEPASVLLDRIRAERAAASDSARPTRGRKKKAS